MKTVENMFDVNLTGTKYFENRFQNAVDFRCVVQSGKRRYHQLKEDRYKKEDGITL